MLIIITEQTCISWITYNHLIVLSADAVKNVCLSCGCHPPEVKEAIWPL